MPKTAEATSKPTNPEPTVEKTFWLCNDCDFSVIGDQAAAAEHFKEHGCYSHWIYEFVMPDDPSYLSFEATGSEMHTSDSLFDLLYVSKRGAYDPVEVLKMFFRARTHPLIGQIQKDRRA